MGTEQKMSKKAEQIWVSALAMVFGMVMSILGSIVLVQVLGGVIIGIGVALIVLALSNKIVIN